MKHVLASLLVGGWIVLSSPLFADDKPAGAPRVLEAGKLPADVRLGPARTYNDAYHPWTPPATKEAWEIERQAIREQMLVGMGLWPMPPQAPLKPVIHGKIEREDYTIEKVFFASHPGHYVSGSLYKPKKIEGRVPGVLCPHGHWQNGRFYELPADKAQSEQIDQKAEKFMSGAQYPLQARMVHLARLGCVVFHYDMVGNADSQQIPHRQGFTDVQAALRLQDFMGLQTFNSIQALNFILSLPEVDPTRIGVTGASGGGTQTFVLCALDPRPTAAFPAVMVGTAMQGGCVCENCNYLRIGINNIAITSMAAPRPLAMSAANDWTLEIERKGLPEMKKIWGLYGQPDLVHAQTWPQFGHNYNQHAREMMYGWFNRHLKLGHKEPIEEREFVPVTPSQLSVYDGDHSRPADATNAEQLKDYLTKVSHDQMAALVPKDAAGLAEYRRVVGTAAKIMLDAGVPATDDVKGASPMVVSELNGYQLYRVSATRKDAGEQIPVVAIIPPNFNGTAVLWIDGAGKKHLFDASGNPTAAVKNLLGAGLGVASADVFMTGEFLEDESKPTSPKVNEGFAGYTFGYNRPWLSNRVHDILTVIGGMKKHPAIKTVHLIGTGDSGPWVLLARGLAGNQVEKCVGDIRGFGFSRIDRMTDPMLLPGGLKYGGIGGLIALAAPAEIKIAGTQDVPLAEMSALVQVYKASGGKLHLDLPLLTPDKAAEWILK